MPHVELNPNLPGITALFDRFSDHGSVLSELAERLLRGPSKLSQTQRELIAAAVSRQNDCLFCCESHAAAARASGSSEDQVLIDATLPEGAVDPTAHPDLKLRSLLEIALATAKGGQQVTSSLVEAARKHGADDTEIHDAILIAAAFCMFNRYVDGHATVAPERGAAAYVGMGQRLANQGYIRA